MKAIRKSRKPDSSPKLLLRQIVGLTARNANGLAGIASARSCVYVAGCVVVVYDVVSGTQSHLLVSHRTPRPLSCVAVSHDGRFIAAGESGSQPSVLLWDYANMSLVSEMKGHFHGVACIAFSPDGKHLVSVGGYIYFWDWQSGRLATKVKASSSCSAIASVTFSSDTKYILTAGNKHLKLWSVALSSRTRFNGEAETQVLQGKPLNLGLQRGQSFVSVTSPIWTNQQPANDRFLIYALTEAGVLCLIRSGSLRNSVDLKVKRAFALSASDRLIACGCSNGLVQLVSMETLVYAGTLSYSMSQKYHVEMKNYDTEPSQKDCKVTEALPDAVACQFSTSEKLVVVYGDHSIYIWDFDDTNKASRCCVIVSHSACIWDIKNLRCENEHDPTLACVARGCSGGVSFATCSADGTIRLWDFLLEPNLPKDAARRNSLVSHLASAGIFVRDTIEPGISAHGFRSMTVSSDGQYLAAGDCDGNIHIYNLYSFEYTCLKGAHDAEVLSLCFSSLGKKSSISTGVKDNNYFLASGGRDRVIHLYDVKRFMPTLVLVNLAFVISLFVNLLLFRNFDHLERIDDHSAAVTSVKLISDSGKLLSCSADRLLVFRDIVVADGSYKISYGHRQMASNGTVYDMALDRSEEVAVTVGQDRKINTFDIASGKLIRSFKQDRDGGDPIKVFMDPSCNYLVCSYSDKSLRMYDFNSGEMVIQAAGHGEVVTGIIFLPDCEHIISVGGDGCIFVWQVPSAFSCKMLQGIKANSDPLSPRSLVPPTAFRHIIYCDKEGNQLNTDSEEMWLCTSKQVGGIGDLRDSPKGNSTFSFSISRLPKWARAKVLSSGSPKIAPSQEPGLAFQDIQTPKKSDIGESWSCITNKSGGAHSSDSPSSTLSQKRNRMDRHWHTIYTVCMDFQNSPEAWKQKDETIPVLAFFQDIGKQPTSSKLLAGSCVPFCEEDSLQALYDESEQSYDMKIENEALEAASSYTSQSESEHRESCNREAADHASEQPFSDRTEKELQEKGNNFNCCEEYEDNTLFDQHFASLSATSKIEERQPSARRRYSAQYVVQRRYLGEWKSFDSLCEELDHKQPFNVVEEANLDSNDMSKSTCKMMKELTIGEPCVQAMKSARNIIISSSCLPGEPTIVESAEERKQKKSPHDEKGVKGKISECSKALLNLESATDTVTHLITDLTSMASEEELLKGSGAGLYNQAAELLPTIAQKVDALARILRLGGNLSVVRN
ncbi:mitogen-activated protein kinase-binding protein 1 isoform X1 [Rhodamnia argentea]|uniref:Mitogen-activated protein kinase-binding protein 1 isoform X1 n=2 Tax=Rhodamnia argentea TaxID=178133 RepID=A0ABM3GRZ8_9MYRT|nr:mitogen-activated protein kinase-binding protein 1 isoform X1 [Rhodamnia argentea]XP_048127130.1 mitogen-activated protein kinase-binding protein 1 isoform X1 [Rhodamnia argentea]